MADEPKDSGPHQQTLISDPVIGTEVSGYRVTGRLGVGGMGIVYQGEQPLIGKRVAIKVLRHEIAGDPEIVERLVAEARAVNQVGHRGIIDVFGVGHLPDGRRCIVMELLDGEPLEAVMRVATQQQQRMPLNDVLVILEEVFSALAAAHAAGVIHRDLKPSNIFLCKQRDGTQFVKLLDFGIAKLGVLGHTPNTRASMMVGTPGYMAPEQSGGGRVGPAMDLYAAGVLAFELLTGQQPFVSENIVELLIQHSTLPPPRVRTLAPDVPEALEVLVGQLLEKKPEARPVSAEVVRQEIVRVRKALTGQTETTIMVEPRASAPQPPAHETPLPKLAPPLAPRVLLVGGAVALALLVGVVMFNRDPPPSHQEDTLSEPEFTTPPAVITTPTPPPAPHVEVEAPTKPVTAAVEPPKPAPSKPTAVNELAQRIKRIEANLARAEADGDDMTSRRKELNVVRQRLQTASSADAERLQFRLIELEAETTP